MTPASAEVVRDLILESGIAFAQNGKSYILTCPRCRKGGKLYVRKRDGRFVCWVCKESQGFQGAPEWCFTELLGIPVQELRKRLYGAELGGVGFLDLQLRDFFEGTDEMPGWLPEEESEVMPDPGFRDLDTEAGSPGLRYLEGRGIPGAVCREYGIQYWPARESVVFPVVQRGRLIGWQTRLIGVTQYEAEGEIVTLPKAQTSFGLRRDRVLMFGDRITGDHAILCEGPVDGLKAHLCGGNAVTLGKAVSRVQLELLRCSGIRRLYLALDPDAFRECKKVLQSLCYDMAVYDMRPRAPFSDLGEMEMTAVPDLMAAAQLLTPQHVFLYLEDHYEGR